MRLILYFAFCVAFKSLEIAAHLSPALDLNNNDSSVLGGSSHDCYRECVANDTRTCYYELVLVEWTGFSSQCGDCPSTMEDCFARGCITAGGSDRLVTTVNYMLPGPSIEVCYGDTIRAKLTNALGDGAATVHWHGMSQWNTSFMDGVPFLTQCPILPGNSFVYSFTADPPGTHIYHSHVGLQETDGFHGGLIIRHPDDVNAKYYDYDLSEHVVIVWHWYNKTTASVTKTAMYQGNVAKGYDFIINGYSSKTEYISNGTSYYTPRANFTVTQGYRYRFRMICNTGIYCPIQVSIDGHMMKMIATDGAPFEPREVDTFMCNAGERWDFVLTANQTIGNYWMRFRGLGNCESSSVNSAAILHYDSAPSSEPSEELSWDDANRSGVLLNPVQEGKLDYSNNTLIRTTNLTNTMTGKYVQNISGTPDYTYYMSISMQSYSSYQVSGPYGQIDNISFALPTVPLLTQSDEVTSDMYCTPDNLDAASCKDGYCTCPYLYEMPKDSLIEIIVVDTSPKGPFDDHPLHLHGYFFYIVASQPGNASKVCTLDEVQSLNEAGSIDKNFDSPPLKDTASVPGRGYIVLRFRSNNPGYWLFHCHVATHFEEGMGVVLKIGDSGDMPKIPPNFPTCSGNYNIMKTK